MLDVKPGLVGASTLGFMDEAERLAAAPDPEAYYQDVLLHERVRLDLAYLDEPCLVGRRCGSCCARLGDPDRAPWERRAAGCKPRERGTQFGGCQAAGSLRQPPVQATSH